jgi:hypothetical protein
MRVALEIREDFTVALVGAQDETIGRLRSLLQRLSRKDAPSTSSTSLANDESKSPQPAVELEITEVNG